MTKENVIFLEPVMTSELIDVHKRFIEYMLTHYFSFVKHF